MQPEPFAQKYFVAQATITALWVNEHGRLSLPNTLNTYTTRKARLN